jgi:hypothetical protein
MTDFTTKELVLMLKNLTEKVETGFKGTHERLDKTNGKVIKNTEWRLKTEGSINVLKFLLGGVSLVTIINVLATVLK